MNHLFYLDECASTQDETAKYFTLKNFENVAVYTFNQTKGKGQYGNLWEAKPNENLAISFCLKAKDISIPANLFNFHTALIFREFIANLTKTEVKIKWPNDLIIKNKKVAGILIEKKKIDGCEVFIIGIGINVLQKNFENLPKAGSIFTQCNKVLDLKTLAESIFEFAMPKFFENESEREILENFNQFLFRKDEVSVFEIEGLRQNGIIKNADEKGFLTVDLENGGLKKFYHKEIEMLY